MHNTVLPALFCLSLCDWPEPFIFPRASQVCAAIPWVLYHLPRINVPVCLYPTVFITVHTPWLLLCLSPRCTLQKERYTCHSFKEFQFHVVEKAKQNSSTHDGGSVWQSPAHIIGNQDAVIIARTKGWVYSSKTYPSNQLLPMRPYLPTRPQPLKLGTLAVGRSTDNICLADFRFKPYYVLNILCLWRKLEYSLACSNPNTSDESSFSQINRS